MKFGTTNANPSNDSGTAQSVTIGDITISQFGDGHLWLEDGDEDAMAVGEEKLAAVLREFYNSNF